MKRNPFHVSVALALILSFVSTPVAYADKKPQPPRAGRYNAGPDPMTEEGRKIIDIYSTLPEYSSMSDDLMDGQKFRGAFGTMLMRIRSFERNSVKIFFVGQDATHFAEGSKQPGTSGFGGRLQALARFFGVLFGVATTNAYPSTIKGQYGAFQHIYVELVDGKPVYRRTKYVDNELWALSHGDESAVRIAREKHWEWVLMNNQDSMKMTVLFGDAAKDAYAQFLTARGFDVPLKMNPEKLKRIQVPETKLVPAGGNNEFPVPIDRNKKDIYEILLAEKYGRVKPYFVKRYGKVVPDYANKAVQDAAVKALEEAGDRGLKMMVFSGGGLHGSGLVHLAQIADYDFDNVTFKGKKVRSLKGMKLKYYDYEVPDHIAFIESEHPTALTMAEQKEPGSAARKVNKMVEKLDELKKDGWKIEPDLDEDGKLLVNDYHEGNPFKWGKGDVDQVYFEQGAPKNRFGVSANASRDGPQVIIMNTRDKPEFDEARIAAAKKSQPSSPIDPEELYSGRPRGEKVRYVFDRGPGEEISEMMANSLDLDAIFKPKKGMSYAKNGIDAYNVKSHPDSGYFGTHRGDFKKSKALILADPHGIDEWYSSRAMTGGRGQYLNGLMNDLGFGDEYLVLRTVPFGMDGATDAEWEVVRKQTEKYREALIDEALKNKEIEMIFVDGKVAKAEMDRILKKKGVTHLEVVDIKRTGLDDFAEGIEEAGIAAKKILKGRKIGEISAKPRDIPRSHMTFWSKWWEGTGGVDFTIDSKGKFRGLGYALVCPDWVVNQDVRLLATTKKSLAWLRGFLAKMGIRIGKQTMPEFFKKYPEFKNGDWYEVEKLRQKYFAGDRNGPSFMTPEECLNLFKKKKYTMWRRIGPGVTGAVAAR